MDATSPVCTYVCMQAELEPTEQHRTSHPPPYNSKARPADVPATRFMPCHRVSSSPGRAMTPYRCFRYARPPLTGPGRPLYGVQYLACFPSPAFPVKTLPPRLPEGFRITLQPLCTGHTGDAEDSQRPLISTKTSSPSAPFSATPTAHLLT